MGKPKKKKNHTTKIPSYQKSTIKQNNSIENTNTEKHHYKKFHHTKKKPPKKPPGVFLSNIFYLYESYIGFIKWACIVDLHVDIEVSFTTQALVK
jgi:hypothetical protein